MPDQNAPSPINELKVSGHTMALDPGIYCVFSSPGSQPPAADTGLPIVRISAVPTQSGGHVELSGLSKDGWISPDSATLVRVIQARTEVLVTVYQAKSATGDAPQLQVVRISADTQPAAAQLAAPPGAQMAAPAPPASIQVVAHIYGLGDVGGAIGEWMGEPGSRRWIEGFGLAPTGSVPSSDIEYQAVLGRGWLSPWSEGGQFCGSRGMSLPILGLRVRLRGASAQTKRISLSATFVDGSKVGPVGAGEPCESDSMAALEAFRLVIEDAAAPAGRTRSVAVKPAVAKQSAMKPKPAKAAPAKAAPAAAVATRSAAAKSAPAAYAATMPAVAKPSAKSTAAKSADTKPAAAKRATATSGAAPAATAPVIATRTAPKARATRTPAPTRRR